MNAAHAARAPGWRLAAYGLLAIPLAMAALPIYVNVPKFYADTIGLDLAAIGGLLLMARIFDAVQDPLLGYWCDRTRNGRFGRRAWWIAGAPLLAAAMCGLFAPPALSTAAMGWWLLSMLLIVYTAFSMVQISYQAYGAEIAHDRAERTRVVSFREGLGLAGVFLAAALPQVLSAERGARDGYAAFALLFVPLALLLAGVSAWLSPPVAARPPATGRPSLSNMLLPVHNTTCRRLLVVFALNGIAAAIPATLVLFFIEDVIQAPRASALFLIAYFAAGTAGMPLWAALSTRIGKARAWCAGMVLSIAAFVWAFTLGADDVAPFLVICVLSGLGLGADLALPASMLADAIDEDEARGVGRNEGAYFGLWNLASKLNLALAAGLSLPLLAWWGYVPGAADGIAGGATAGTAALATVYALLPCALKAGAAVVLWRSPLWKNT